MSDKEMPLLYVYHVLDGKIVMDRATSTHHMRQNGLGIVNGRHTWIASAKTPLTDAEKAAFAKQYGMEFDETARPALKPHVRPESQKR